MADLIDQCEAWAWLSAAPTRWTAAPSGCATPPAAWQWYQGFARATAQAEAEFTAAVGEEVATVVRIALEMYGADAGRLA